MPNEPKPAAEKRPPTTGPRANGQSDHEGSAHRPEEFNVMNPAQMEEAPDRLIPNVQGAQAEGYFGSQAWESTSPDEQAAERGPTAPPALTSDQKRSTPKGMRGHAALQGGDERPFPRGRSPDSAMGEDCDHPGRIDGKNEW